MRKCKHNSGKLSDFLIRAIVNNAETKVWQKFIAALSLLESPYREIIKLYFSGKNNTQIASELGISVKTISTLLVKSKHELITKLHNSTRVKQ